MLSITIPKSELWDDVRERFINIEEQTICLEHSLVSVSMWESKWCKPFFSNHEKTHEETIDYVRCMTLTENVDPNVYYGLSMDNVNSIKAYIDAPMTATTFSDKGKGRKNREVITSEVIYYWMVALNIPMECERWHLNRLITLVRVCNEKNNPGKKMSSREIASRNAAINAANRKRFGSKG